MIFTGSIWAFTGGNIASAKMQLETLTAHIILFLFILLLCGCKAAELLNHLDQLCKANDVLLFAIMKLTLEKNQGKNWIGTNDCFCGLLKSGISPGISIFFKYRRCSYALRFFFTSGKSKISILLLNSVCINLLKTWMALFLHIYSSYDVDKVAKLKFTNYIFCTCCI